MRRMRGWGGGGRGAGGGLYDFRFGAFIGRFQSDSAESMVAKGLNLSLSEKKKNKVDRLAWQNIPSIVC